MPPAGGGYAAAAPQSTNTMAIISLVVAIIALLPLCVFLGPASLVLGIIAAVLGFVARNQIRQRGQGGNGLAMAGLIIGIAAAVLGLLEFVAIGVFVNTLGSIVPSLATAVSLTATAGAGP